MAEPTGLRVTMLGTGTSQGVPTIGCDCDVCRSTDERDKRLRPSVRIEAGGLTVVIDAGPDFRQQMLRAEVTHLDAVLLTHHHADHIFGLDDLRAFNFRQQQAIPIYGRDAVLTDLRTTFRYVFENPHPGLPEFDLRRVTGPFALPMPTGGVLTVEPVDVFHGRMLVTGYRIGPVAYLTDTNRLPDEAYGALDGINTLVLDALRIAPHPTHFSLEEAIAVARRVGARQTYFTHMSHHMGRHDEVNRTLPDGLSLAHDGLSFTVPFPC